MSRGVRLEYEGAFYHVTARGNRRQAIFCDDEDRRAYLRALGTACERTGWRVHAWVLMGNHYHLFIETPEPNLVAGMKWLQNAYTRRFNTRHGEWGRLFGDRYKAIPVEGRAGEYYVALCDYIHLNPVRAGLIRRARKEDLLAYPWSSLAAGYASAPGKRAPWLAAEAGLEAMDCADTVKGRRRYVERLERRVSDEAQRHCGMIALPPEADGRKSHLRRGWYWGTQAFAEKLQALMGAGAARVNRTYRAAAQHQAHGEMEARRLLAEGLERESLKPEDLTKLPGSDARKVRVARELWKATTVDQRWIAAELGMKSAANVSQILRRSQQTSVKIC